MSIIMKYLRPILQILSNRNIFLADFIASKTTSSPLANKVIQKSLAVTITTLILTSIVITITSGMKESLTMKEKIETASNRIAFELALPIWNIDEGMIDTLLSIEISDNDISRIELFNSSGALFRGAARDVSGDPFFYDTSLYAKNERPLFGATKKIPFVLNDKEFGYGIIHYSFWNALGRMAANTAVFIVLFLFMAIIMFVVILRVLQKRVIFPVLHLSEIVYFFSQNNFTSRVSYKSEDELGTLAEKINEMADKIEKYNRKLEQMVDERTKQLISAEKMAALGELVAGISHEINTPIGTAVTAASFLEKKAKLFLAAVAAGTLSKNELDSYLRNIDEAMKLVLANLSRAADLVQSFKKVAVDRSSSEKRKFMVKEYLNDIITSLKPRLKHSGHTIDIDTDDYLEINSYPGDISQIFTNLIINSLIHAFPEKSSKGVISIRAVREDKEIIFVFSDNGVGIPEENLPKIFNPFFTTKRGTGGSGLGLNIVYNIITQKLNGTIECRSSIDIGTSFIIRFPE